MEIPSKVSVFNKTLEVKGKAGMLVSIGDGFFEVNMDVNQKMHTVLFPVAETVLIFNDPLPQIAADFEVER